MDTPNNAPTPGAWATRPETPADVAAVRRVNLAAFPTAEEADLVEQLRADADAWIDGLSFVAENAENAEHAEHAENAVGVVGHALLTRCHIDDSPALALAPCAVVPAYQRRGVGSAVIHAALEAARALGEHTVVVLGHPAYYPRFGFTPAAAFGISAPFEAPEDALMARTLDADRPAPTGTIRYPAAFGV